jgi:hypothetical protein
MRTKFLANWLAGGRVAPGRPQMSDTDVPGVHVPLAAPGGGVRVAVRAMWTPDDGAPGVHHTSHTRTPPQYGER